MLNPALDPTSLAERFRSRGRLQIRDFLEPDVAGTLHRCLAQEVRWRLAYRDGRQAVTRPMEELEQLPSGEQAELAAKIQRQAGEGYQYVYNSHLMITAYLEGGEPRLLHRVVEFINSPAFLEFARRLSGIDAIIKADAQATRYLPGYFLRKHNDFDGEEGRELAYVINLSRDWQADWGGLLQFLDEDGEVVETFLPHFNSLSLFRVPALHCVSCVSPYAVEPRLAITGWLRSC